MGKRYKKRSNYNSMLEFLTSKRCLVNPKPDGIREGRAVSIARCYVLYPSQSKEDVNKRKQIRETTKAVQRREAIELMCGVSNQCNTVAIMRDLQVKLGFRYRIDLYMEPTSVPKYSFGKSDADYKLRFLVTGQEERKNVSYITNLKALLAKGFECPDCGTITAKRIDHSCRAEHSKFCNSCKRRECRTRVDGEPPKQTIQCKDCKVFCHGAGCLKAHKCRYLYCDECDRRYPIKAKRPGGADHAHYEYKCVSCRNLVPPDHSCFLQQLTVKELHGTGTSDDVGGEGPLAVYQRADENAASLEAGASCPYFFFDIETYQSNDGFHIPYLIVAIHADGERHVFDGPTCMSDFCDFAFSPEHKRYRFFSHNGSAFDTILVSHHLRQTFHTIEPLIQDGRIMQIFLPDLEIYVRDFYLLSRGKLADMPKVLGLEATQKKGFFPHKCFAKTNYETFKCYRGEIPDLAFFDTRATSDSRRRELLQWHTNWVKSGEDYDILRESVKYCIDDTETLRKAALKFRWIFLKLTSGALDPLMDCMTIAQTAMTYYRLEHLPENTIGIIPNRGVERQKTHSIEALTWLDWVSCAEKIKIQHARNRVDDGRGGERRIGKKSLDGYGVDCDGVRTAFEYYSCFFHGCPKCYNPDSYNTVTNCRFKLLWTQTRERERLLEDKYKLTVSRMWQCDWKRRIETEPLVAQFCRSLSYRPPLNPREALRGGRNECFTALAEFPDANDPTILRALDVVSLYPSVMFYKYFPVGHPVVHVGSAACSLNHFTSFGDTEGTIGLLHCEILSPRNLLIPLLALCVGDTSDTERLFFCVCRTCGQESLNVSDSGGRVPHCNHNEKQRAMQGVYTSPEVLKAVQLGYRVLQIYEEYVFEKSSADIFKSYISTIFRLKAEASGWPVDGEAERAEYMKEFTRRMGTSLEPSKMVRNNGIRQISKLLLNSLYGKFGQRSRRREYKYVDSVSAFDSFINSPEYTLIDVTFVNENRTMLELERNDNVGEHAVHCNLTIASLITAYARLELYRIFEAIGPERIHYCDTDSAIFTWPRGEPLPESLSCGGFLGDLEDVEGKSNRLTHYVSCGQKTYAYRYINDATGEFGEQVKAKGVSTQMREDGGFKYEALRRLLLENGSTIVTGEDSFRRDTTQSTIRTAPRSLRIKPTLTKRQFFPEKGYTSKPFGFVE